MQPLAQRPFLLLAIILIPALTLLGPAPAQGDGKIWVGGDSSWFTDGNWNPSGVPTAGTDVFIDTGIANIDTGSAVAHNIHFGTYSGASGTITQNGGTLTVSDNTPGLMLGSQPGGEGYYNLQGGSLSTQTEAIGNGGYGEFVQKAGTSHTVAIGMVLGQMTGGEGKYTLEGGSLSLGTTGSLVVGGPGTGTFIMQNGTLETGPPIWALMSSSSSQGTVRTTTGW